MNDQAAERAELRGDGSFMTVTEVADYLDLHRITIYRLVKKGVHLGQFKVGGAWRFSRDDIMRFGAERRPNTKSDLGQEGGFESFVGEGKGAAYSLGQIAVASLSDTLHP